MKEGAPLVRKAQNVVGDVNRVQRVDVISKPSGEIDERRPIGFEKLRIHNVQPDWTIERLGQFVWIDAEKIVDKKFAIIDVPFGDQPLSHVIGVAEREIEAKSHLFVAFVLTRRTSLAPLAGGQRRKQTVLSRWWRRRSTRSGRWRGQ